MVENPLLTFLQSKAVPEHAAPGIGYIYVIGFYGPDGYTKVGSTRSPRTRLLTLYYAAKGLTLAGVWLSPAHPDYLLQEKQALAHCREIAPASTPRSEYFHGLAFEEARSQAAKVAFGIRSSSPDCSPPLYLPHAAAAGQQELLPHYLRSKVNPDPPDPGEVFAHDFALRARFAHGSARTRFLRRHVAEPANGELLQLQRAPRELVTAEQAADLIGASSAGSARRTLSRWGVTAVDHRPSAAGRLQALFDADQVRDAHRNRPRRGRRSTAPLTPGNRPRGPGCA